MSDAASMNGRDTDGLFVGFVLGTYMWRDRLATGSSSDALRRGFVTGIPAAVLVFALTALVRLIEISRSPGGVRLYLRPDGADGMLSVFAGTFYGAHPGAYHAPVWLDTVLQRYDTVPDVIYVLIVAVVLLAAGWFAARTARSESGGVSAIDSACRGAAVTTGYAPAVVFGALALDGLIDLGPVSVLLDQTLTIALVAGLVSPVVAGTIGGLLAMYG